MIDLSELNGATLALLLLSVTESGEDNWAVFSGTVRLHCGKVIFDRGSDSPEFELRREWLDRITPTDDETRPLLLDAPYYLPLQVDDLAEDADLSGLRSTGLRWPEQ
jgi:hypothetical protein